MALKATLDTLDGLPDAIAKEYKEVKDEAGTRYILDTEGVEDVTGLKSALKAERDTRSKLEKALKRLGLKSDPKALDEALEKAGDKTLEELIDAAQGKAASESEAVTQAERKAKRQLEEKDAELNASKSFIRRLVVENAAKDAIVAAEGNPKLLLPHVTSRVDVVEEKNSAGEVTYKAVVKDEDGQPRVGTGGKDFTTTDLVTEMKNSPDYADAFAGSGASGSGADGGDLPGRTRGAPVVRTAGTRDAVQDKKRTINYKL